jgi:hypothetical protein
LAEVEREYQNTDQSPSRFHVTVQEISQPPQHWKSDFNGALLSLDNTVRPMILFEILLRVRFKKPFLIFVTSDSAFRNNAMDPPTHYHLTSITSKPFPISLLFLLFPSQDLSSPRHSDGSI